MPIKPKSLPSKEQLREFFDYKDGTLILKKTLGKKKAGHVLQAFRPHHYFWLWEQNRSLHRLIWAWHHGDPGDALIDHIDQNPLNNRIENLRRGDYSINAVNAPAKTNTGVRGIQKRGDVYRVTIQQTHLGTYHSFEEALEVRNAAQEKLWPTITTSLTA